jgi:hypothetical protein
LAFTDPDRGRALGPGLLDIFRHAPRRRPPKADGSGRPFWSHWLAVQDARSFFLPRMVASSLPTCVFEAVLAT